jgi:hypothetical protein
MSSLADLTKTPFKFTAEDGREFKLSPITPAVLGAVERWVEELPFDNLRARLLKVGEFLGPEQKMQLYADAAAESVRFKRMLSKAREEPIEGEESELEDESLPPNPLESINGVRKLFFEALKVNHPEITEEQASQLVTLDNLLSIQNLLDRASGADEETDEKAEGKADAPGTAH